jgi:hypothetical protein
MTEDIYVYVVYNVLVDEELNISCVFNEVLVNNRIDFQTSIAQQVLSILKHKEMKKQLEEVIESHQNDTSQFELKAT